MTMTNCEAINHKKKRFVDYLPCWLTNLNSMFYYFVFLILLGILFFSTSLLVNCFTTPFTGDYVAQQYAFYTNGYDDWWHFFRTGEFVLYDANTFLGVDNIGSNTFYYLFDPFFLPILFCPRDIIPQCMSILTIFKMSACGMIFYVYMRYLGASKRASKISGIAYAFSGWITWYIWFNHFTDIAIVFPLILLGIEKILKEKKPWVLMSSICLMGFVNFFFCFSLCICALFYALFRFFQNIKHNSLKNNLIISGMCLGAFVVGLLMPMVIILPSITHALTSPRASSGGYLDYLKEALKTGNLKKAFELIFTWTALSNSSQDQARALYPFIDFIFPVTNCRGTPLTLYFGDTYDNIAGSSYCFIPMMLLLAPAFINSIRNKHYSVIIPFVFFIVGLFTPFLYYLFHGFTQAYSRWTIFVTTSIIAYSGLYIDKFDDDNPAIIFAGWSFLIVMCIVGSICASVIVNKYSLFSERYPIWLVTLIECIYISILAIVLFLLKNHKKPNFYVVFTGFLITEVALMGAFVINGQGVENYYNSNKGLVQSNELYSVVKQINKKDKSFFRMYSSQTNMDVPNDGMRNNYNGISFFHSVYNYNTADLCNWSAISRGIAPKSWNGVYIQKRINLDTLLGVKYYLIEDNYFSEQKILSGTSDSFRYNAPLGYIDASDSYSNSKFKVYQNQNYIDFALSYDKVIKTNGNPVEKDSYSGLYEVPRERNVLLNEELYLSHAIINEATNDKIISDISQNHKDISFYESPDKTLSDYYKEINMVRYSESGFGSTDEAMLTFFDVGATQRSTTDLDSTEFLSLDKDSDAFDKTPYPAETNNDKRYIAVIESKDSYFPNYDPSGNIFYLSLPFITYFDFDVYFVDDTNKIVTFDNHNDGNFNGDRKGMEWRGFYTAPTYSLDEKGNLINNNDAPKIQKIIIVSRNKRMAPDIKLLMGTNTSFNAKINSLKEHQVYDVITSANTYRFKSSFEKERIVVTRLAYEDGFFLIMTKSNGQKEKVEVFNGQGGFVSFISGVGDCSYELTFTTPYFGLGTLLSAIGVVSFFGSLLAYYYVERKKEYSFLLESLHSF